MRADIAAVSIAIALAAGTATAQGLNPEISVIGDFRAFVSTSPADSKADRLQFDLRSLELALGGYLNPFARADVVVGYHDGEFELEEAYATILRGLPGRLQIKAGKYRLDFGKLNQLHPHAYSFGDTPLVHQHLLGEEGLVDIGINLNTQIAIGRSALTVSANVLKGDFATSHQHGHDEHVHLDRAANWGVSRVTVLDEDEHEEETETDIGTSQRLGLFVPTGDYAGFEVGINALQGTLDRYTDRTVTLWGADIKYRWAPDRYRSLTVQGEWVRSRRDALHHHHHEGEAHTEIERVEASGFFAFVDWRLAQRWNLGAIVEQSELAEQEGVKVRRAGVFAGFAVMEESTLVRLLVRRTDHDELRRAYNEVILQLVFSLGPHKAHWF